MTDGDVAELTVLAKHNRALVTRPRLWGAVRVVDLAGAQRRIASLLKVLRKAYPLRSGVPEAVDTDEVKSAGQTHAARSCMLHALGKEVVNFGGIWTWPQTFAFVSGLNKEQRGVRWDSRRPVMNEFLEGPHTAY